MANRHSFLLIFPMLFSAAVLYLLLSDELDDDSINPVIGHESYVQIYGEEPGKEISSQVRIRIHLEYVENVLRARPVDHLSDDQRKNRSVLLDHLRDYILSKESVNTNFTNPAAASSAVGYLALQTAQPEIAGIINKELSEHAIFEIDHPAFLNWKEEFGVNREELAMIQPVYHQTRDSYTLPPLF